MPKVSGKRKYIQQLEKQWFLDQFFEDDQPSSTDNESDEDDHSDYSNYSNYNTSDSTSESTSESETDSSDCKSDDDLTSPAILLPLLQSTRYLAPRTSVPKSQS